MDISPAHNQSLEDLARENVLHPFTSPKGLLETGPTVMLEGKGARLTDAKGKVYLDGLAGLWCVNAGYGRIEIAEAIFEQAKKLPYYHQFSAMGTEPGIYTADKVKRLAPGRMARVLFGCSGSDANDTQVKIAWYYNNLKGRPQKKKILARNRAYHGVTVAAGSLTGLAYVHDAFDLPVLPVIRLTCPHYYHEQQPGESEDAFCDRLVEELKTTIEREGAETIAAFIAEPVMGAGGVVFPPKGYFEKVSKVLKDNDILFIADEVICGFGRLGTPFGADYFGFEPDMISVAKGITSGYQPLSAVLVGEEVWETIRDASAHLGVFGHGYTYTAHPIACAAANANLDIMEREKLFDNAAETGAYLQEKLRQRFAGDPHVGEIRGAGMIAAVELSADPATRKTFDPSKGVGKAVAAEAMSRGLIVRPMMNDALAMSPPLIITRADVDEMVDNLAASIDAKRDMIAAAAKA
ncbi:hypothetical protein DLJ53_00245 [Acuticoccus sediminis]|uniref:L-2,4-diaminobutyrate transaminase n=1 Tax=Acuticoccus sediminis TaxID=2184697 RepID=A0A8B2NUJ2_9HYPH|nr:aminotransferase [Acuticoccus sediminis]RAI03003.1 hypothetical protein DLJ53_00245 [Acuticoccus sediminis]